MPKLDLNAAQHVAQHGAAHAQPRVGGMLALVSLSGKT